MEGFKVKCTGLLWVTDLIIVFIVLLHSNGVRKGMNFHIPNFVAVDEFSHLGSRFLGVAYAISSRINHREDVVFQKREGRVHTVAALVAQIRIPKRYGNYENIRILHNRYDKLPPFQSVLHDCDTDL